MSFTDLDEHLAEAFGDAERVEFAHARPQTQRKGSRRAFISRHEKHRREHMRRMKRAAEQFLLEARDGTRPTRCKRVGCCNVIHIVRGPVQLFCGRACKAAHQERLRPARIRPGR